MTTESPPSRPEPPGQRGSRWWRRGLGSWSHKSRRMVGAGVFMVLIVTIGSVFLVTMDVVDHVFSTQTFCATTCHVMEINVAKEMEESDHWNGPSGVQAKCKDCHLSSRLSYAMVEHFVATGELFVWLMHDVDKPGEFEPFRPAAADRVRLKMLRNDSARCRDCHTMEAIKPERVRGQNQHAEAMEKGITCIICHYNLVHKAVEPSPAFQAAIERARGDTEETTDEQAAPFATDEQEGEVL